MLEHRKRRVRALLGSIHDPYEHVRREPGETGPAESRRVPCRNCRDNPRWPTCPVCDGTGWRRRHKNDDEYDEYIGEPVRTARTKTRAPVRKFFLNRDIERLFDELQRLGRVDEPDMSVFDHALVEAARHDRRGSYRELRRALGALSRRSECVYAAVSTIYLSGLGAYVRDTRLGMLEEIGVCFLAHEMRGEIRTPHPIHDEVVERTLTIEELRAAGMSARQIARRLRMPLKSVKEKLRNNA